MYYLHPCAAVTAMWLTDYDVDQAIVDAYRTTTTAASLVCLDMVAGKLYPITNDVLWCLQSAHHYVWLVQLFYECSLRSNNKRDRQLKPEVVTANLRRLAVFFPDEPPSFPDAYKAQRAYADDKALCAWVRSTPPFWAVRHRHHPTTQRKDAPQPDDILADLM